MSNDVDRTLPQNSREAAEEKLLTVIRATRVAVGSTGGVVVVTLRVVAGSTRHDGRERSEDTKEKTCQRFVSRDGFACRCERAGPGEWREARQSVHPSV